MTSHISQEQISAWLDGQLEDDSTRQIKEHLETCPGCRAVRDEMSALDRLFRGLEVVSPPSYLWSKISAGLDQAASSPRGWFSRRGFAVVRPVWKRVELWGLAAALVVGCSIAVMQWSNYRTERERLAEIDRAYRTLTPQNAESYNPFATSQIDTSRNPFRLGKLDSGFKFGSPIVKK